MPDPQLAAITVLDILEHIPEMALVYRSDGLLMAMNGVCARSIGVPADQVVGRFNMFAEGSPLSSRLIEGYRAAFRGQAQVVPATEVTQPGTDDLGYGIKLAVRWVETTMIPLCHTPDGAAPLVLAIQRDVTEVMSVRREIAEARTTIDIQQDTIDSLEAARQEIENQRATIQALATPVIEVWDGIITLPLLGHFDGARASAMTSQLLDAVVRTRARYAILDLTGLAVIDTTTGDHIVRIVSAVGLLGATGVLVGIQAEIAQLLVSLGVDLGRVRVHQNLRQALKACMADARA